jgi:hypothetical protein
MPGRAAVIPLPVDAGRAGSNPPTRLPLPEAPNQRAPPPGSDAAFTPESCIGSASLSYLPCDSRNGSFALYESLAQVAYRGKLSADSIPRSRRSGHSVAILREMTHQRGRGDTTLAVSFRAGTSLLHPERLVMIRLPIDR